MCFYDQHRFACGDWKWGHFRQHCAKEHRAGMTCGMKLVMQTIPIGMNCKLCERVNTRMRHRAAEVERLARWQREGEKLQALDKSMESLAKLDKNIAELLCERNRRRQRTGSFDADPGGSKLPQKTSGGSALEKQGKYGETETTRWLGPEGKEKALGPKHPDTLYHSEVDTVQTKRRDRNNEKSPQFKLETTGILETESPGRPFRGSIVVNSTLQESQDTKEIQRDTITPSEMNIILEHLRWYEATENERNSLMNTNLVQDEDDEMGQYYSKTTPASPSYASSVASVFSIASLASSATGLSRSSGYSAVQIASATKVLLSVFQEDASLLPLYKNAMNDPCIGPDRLRRNLRRIFKAYSKHLEAEATERLEFLTSRLVMMKSDLLATSIVEKLQTDYLVSNDEQKYESSDEDGDGGSEAYPVNEEAFEDLDVFREFLVKSEAFQNLLTQVQVFAKGKSTQKADACTMESKEILAKGVVQQRLAISATQERRSLTWESWIKDITQTMDGLLRHTSMKNAANAMMLLFADAFMLATDGIFIALGQLEPPLKPGMTRLRWRCGCGDHLYSDVLELYPGGIFELTGHMQRTSGAKVQASFYNYQSSGQKYIVPRPGQWIRNAWRKIRVVLGRATQTTASLPQHNTQCHSNASAAPNNRPRQKIIHLLACMHRNKFRIRLNQDRIEGVTTDRTLLCFLRRQYMNHRGSILHLISLKTITGLWFVKFWLPIGGSVSIRHHERCCVAASSVSMTCECIPPAPKVEPSPGAEYRCIPGPPATYPPIPPEYLSSLITCPADVHEKDTWILDQLPKRTCGELQGEIGKPAEGWGVYYQEGWDHEIIALVILVVFVAASLLFGILWSRYHFDIQGAFGVSACIMAFCSVLIHVVSNQADKAG